jgi:hypothetical protein
VEPMDHGERRADEPEAGARDSGSSHDEALAHYRAASQRPGTAGADRTTRNRACPACLGVIPFEARTCPHCAEPIPAARFDYFNYTDFEPDVEEGENRRVRRTVGALFLLGVAFLAWLFTRCSP